MTRATGTHIIKAPCCGAFLGTAAYASINFLAWEYWTDGYADGSLAPGGCGLRRCTCGRCFLIQSAEVLKTIRYPKPMAPPGWDTRRDNWLTRFFGRESREDVLERYDIRSPREIELELGTMPPHPKHVYDSELEDVIASNMADIHILNTARRLYWRYLNSPFREEYRAFRAAHTGEVDADGNSATFPDYFPTDKQLHNMEQLVLFQEASVTPDWLELAELRRELGDFAGATAALRKLVGEKQRLHYVVEKLVDRRVQGPVMYRF